MKFLSVLNLAMILYLPTMGQKLQLTKRGIDNLEPGKKVFNLMSFKPIEVHPKRQSMMLSYEEEYDYFYHKNDSLYIEGIGRVKDLVIGLDKFEVIAGVILYIDDTTQSTVKVLSSVYDKPKISSQSSINNEYTYSKLLWKTPDGLSVFYTKYIELSAIKVSLSKLHPESHTPGVTFF